MEWHTAQEEAVAGKKKTNKKMGRLICGGETILDEFPWSGSTLRMGMPLLSRGRTLFDLPHGKIYIEKESTDVDLPQNHSGLKLSFKLNKFGERELLVASVERKSPAADKGLVKGARITKINEVSAVDSDLWGVEQILSGGMGQQVLLEIESPGRSALDDVKTRKVVLQLPLDDEL